MGASNVGETTSLEGGFSIRGVDSSSSYLTFGRLTQE